MMSLILHRIKVNSKNPGVTQFLLKCSSEEFSQQMKFPGFLSINNSPTFEHKSFDVKTRESTHEMTAANI
ncbi:unnamed protein product [Schistosoma curassoni]|uniref:Ovule protein n=1 Tax=Schistosoma curassoni TaxID=6186 RepID=A0A183JS95_9TREM|nr:unnamed protein product [Schistosoma curassoni]